MTGIITKVEKFDNKRMKVTIDYGEVTFILYNGEIKSLRIAEGAELRAEEYDKIKEDILIPRAKKRVMYYLKNADKSRAQITRKLKEGFYPEDVVQKTMEFIDLYGFADDKRYAENYIESYKETKSKREIEAKLYMKGIKGSDIKELLDDISAEDEYASAKKALKKKYPREMKADDRNKAYGYLARKGFSYDAIEHAVNALIIKD